jgi:hypothetical protein
VSDTGSLPPCLVEQQRCGDADVQRLHAPRERDRHRVVACAAYQRAQALSFETSKSSQFSPFFVPLTRCQRVVLTETRAFF